MSDLNGNICDRWATRDNPSPETTKVHTSSLPLVRNELIANDGAVAEISNKSAKNNTEQQLVPKVKRTPHLTTRHLS